MPKSLEQTIADLLFGVQIVGAFIFCASYFFNSLDDITGSSLVQFCLVEVFLVLHLALAFGAYQVFPSRGTRQAIATYFCWIVFLIAVISAVIMHSQYAWNQRETTQLITAIVLTILVLTAAALHAKTLADPMIKAYFAISYKSVPQMLLAWKFLVEGASGTPGAAVFIGHFTILVRLGHLYFLVRLHGWNRSLKWLAISEALNELSWICATAAWFWMIH